MGHKLDIKKKDRVQLWKLSKAEMEYFKGRVEFWVDLLGMSEWKFNVENESVRHGDYRARFEWFRASHNVLITLNKIWDESPDDIQIDEVAFHEVFESVYFGPLRAIAMETRSPSHVDELTHTQVNRAEKTIFLAMR